MSEDPAKTRFVTIQLVRLAGVALAILGLAITAGKIALPVEAGYVLFLLGLFFAMAMPIALTRRWKSRGE